MTPPVDLQPLNFSKTQRLVLLVDLDPLLTLQNPSSYLAVVKSAADRLLRFPPLAASLTAFKLFFSSLSPLRSAAALPRQISSSSLSFNLPPQTLDSLSATLDSISALTDLPNSPGCARASNAMSSLLQLIHDYSWENEKDNTLGEDDFVKIPSNLVILLSPIGQSINCLVDYLESREFNEVFCVVREAFEKRDIHLCWVDVKSDQLEIAEVDNVKKNACKDELAMMKECVRKIGWGFCSSDLIVLASALLPLGLIYPKIGVAFDFNDFGRRKYSGELNLEILDVNGMPLQCKGCNLEFMNSLSCSVETDDILNASESRDSQSFCGLDALLMHVGEGKLKLHVKSVHRYDECEMIRGSSDIVLVSECFQEFRKTIQKRADDLFPDRVLEMLHEEIGRVGYRNQTPTWQMFLSFLHMEGYWALISLSSSNGDKLMGSLMPFTAHLAIMCITDADQLSFRDQTRFNVTSLGEELNESNLCSSSQTDTSMSSYSEKYGDGKRKKSRRRLYQDMTWSSFCKAAFGGSNFDMFELYTAKYLEKSKILKFLKCWMKQISRVDRCFLTTLPVSKSVEESSACNAVSCEPSLADEGMMPVSMSETPETFLNNLSERIEHSIESGMDLQKLAARVVKSSIHWLHCKCEIETNSEGQQSMRTSDDFSSETVVGEKLMQLLLRSPKEMKKIHEDPSPFPSSEHIVQEYELQILLRMEILRSDVSAMIRDSRKRKLLKQICSLLEIIQYLVAGGIHGHISLYDYVERTIKARYSDELEDIVKKIYTRMDLLPFGEEIETPCLLFNSEDSNQSWRDKHDKNEKAEANSINQSVSTEGESSQPSANASESLEERGKNDYTRSLNEARERRERARRFAPFVSKALDLQRVWAPKQAKATKCKLDPLPKKLKRKDKQTPYSVVCETPMTGNKRACSRVNNSKGESSNSDLGNPSCSVSKALFQDN